MYFHLKHTVAKEDAVCNLVNKFSKLRQKLRRFVTWWQNKQWALRNALDTIY